MPKLAYYRNLIFFIVSYDLSERIHVHVYSKSSGRGNPAKIWLDNHDVFDQGALSEEELNLSVKLISKNTEKLSSQIEAFRNGKKVKSLELKLK